MDERGMTRKPYLTTLADQMADMVEALSAIDPDVLRAA